MLVIGLLAETKEPGIFVFILLLLSATMQYNIDEWNKEYSYKVIMEKKIDEIKKSKDYKIYVLEHENIKVNR